jgi:hypothetical protein
MRAASTPPIDSISTFHCAVSNERERSASNWRVAIDEIPVIVVMRSELLDEVPDEPRLTEWLRMSCRHFFPSMLAVAWAR